MKERKFEKLKFFLSSHFSIISPFFNPLTFLLLQLNESRSSHEEIPSGFIDYQAKRIVGPIILLRVDVT